MYNLEDVSGLRKLNAGNAYSGVNTYSSLYNNYLDKYHEHYIGQDDYRNVDDLVQKLQHIKQDQKAKYLEDLMYPEKTLNAKIPNAIPFPSASFKMHNTVTITTNTLGNAALVFNPFYLSTSSGSCLFVNNDVTLTGASYNANFSEVQIGQQVPAIYSEYRLVSSSVVITCKSSQLNLSGTFSGAIILDPNASANRAMFGNFNNIDDGYYSQIVPAKDGIRMLYFPIDPSYEQFYPMGSAKWGFNYAFYAQGCQSSSACLRLDFYSNWEATPNADYMQYIPRSLGCNLNSDDKSKVVEQVQKNSITIPSYNVIPNNKIDTQDITRNVDKLQETLSKLAKLGDLAAAQVANNKFAFSPLDGTGNDITSRRGEVMDTIMGAVDTGTKLLGQKRILN